MTHYTVDWYLENQVVLAAIASNFLTIEALQAINVGLIDHIRASDAEAVDVILDCQQVVRFQSNIALINRTLSFVREPKLRWMVVISDDKMLNLTATVVAQVSHVKLHNAPDIDTAGQFLQSVDPVLKLR